MIAGAVSGPLSRTLTAPLDRIRVVIQVSSKKQNTLECMKDLLQEGGIRSFWRGNGINVLKTAPEMGLRFGIFDFLKNVLDHNSRQPILAEKFAVASAAGILSQITIYPLEVIKTRLTLRKTGEYRGMLDAVRQVYVHEGWKSFYRGYRPSCIGIIPFIGVDLTCYESLKSTFVKEQKNPTIWNYMWCATVSTTLGQYSSYPFYLAKARLQGNSQHSSVSEVQGSSVYRIFKHILQREGFVGLYRGMVPNLLKVLPAGALNYAAYEQTLCYLSRST